MEKHAYLIMAHNQWDILKVLLDSIDDPRNEIFLHIDKKANDYPRAEIDKICKYSRITYTKPFDIRWGGTEMMACEMQMLETALSNGGYAYIHLLSGVDLPLKSQDFIHAFFSKHAGYEFIGFDWNNIDKGTFRYRSKYYHFFTKWIGRGSQNTLCSRIVKKLNSISLAVQRFMNIDRLHGMVFYKGSQWFSITQGFAEYVIKHKQELLSQYRHCLNPDEAFLQNLIKESPSDLFPLASSNMRYILWQQGEPSPLILTMNNYPAMKESDAIFARKFDWFIDSEVIIRIAESLKD